MVCPQQAAVHKRSKQRRKQTWLSSTSSTDLGVEPQRIFDETRPTISHLGDLGLLPQDLDERPVPKAQAMWFLSLPEKIQRQHFDRNEARLLTEACNRALRRTSPQLAAQVQHQPAKDFGIEGKPSDHDRWVPEINEDASKSMLPTTDRLHPISPEPHDTGAGTSTSTPLRFATLSPGQSSSLRTKPKHKSFHRALSLTPLTLPPPTLAPLPPVPSPLASRPLALSARLSQPYMDVMPLLEGTPPEGRYSNSNYPEVRKRPCQEPVPAQAMDEVIAFGFTHLEPTPPSPTSSSLPIQRPSSEYTNDEDNTSLESRGPPTPTGGIDQNRMFGTSSFYSGVGLPLQLHTGEKMTEWGSTSTTSRKMMTPEMSSRVTPELRTSEEQLYSWQRTQNSGVHLAGSDLLALEALTVCDDPTGAQGAFAVRRTCTGKGFRRVWKSFRRR